MFPQKFAPALFGLILSGLMSLLVSGIATLRSVGLPENFVALWAGGWLTSWIVAFPIVLVISPITRRVVAMLVGDRS
ncbi:MAG: DUF2798 domain-containing protein [Burkholderiales bacterium]|nr:DUF2798 domain-containing protein [Burkholderiales bacterium]